MLEMGSGLGPAKCFCFGWVFCGCAGEGRTVQLSLQVVLCSSRSAVVLAHEPEMCKDRAILPAEHDPGLLCKEHPRPLWQSASFMS